MLDLIEELVRESGEPGGDGLSSGDVAAICDVLEEASARPDRNQLKLASDALERGFRALLAGAPKSAQQAVIGGQSGSAERAAFDLGQINFAQAFAAQAYERRADGDFAAVIVNSQYEQLIRALAERPMSGVDLATRLATTVETISRKLRDLREKGIADYRQEGTHRMNFLTPPAASVVQDLGLAPLPRAQHENSAEAALREVTDRLEPYMQTVATFNSRRAA